MPYFWITFQDAPPRCCWGKDEDHAADIATAITEEQIASVHTLPYPASPKLYDPYGHTAFCTSPERCKGHTCCPSDRACND